MRLRDSSSAPSDQYPLPSPPDHHPEPYASTPPMGSGYSPSTYLPYLQNPTANSGSSATSNPNPKPSPIPSFSLTILRPLLLSKFPCA
ncbi:hypothetical protein SLA2020_275790 [Shorea laevis]